MKLTKAAVGVIGWLLSYCYFPVALWNLDNASCIWDRTVGTTDVWSVGFVGGVLILALSIPLILIGREHAFWMRWMAIPSLLMAIHGFLLVYTYLQDVTIAGVHLCDFYHYGYGEGEPEHAPLLHRLWAPGQLLLLVSVLALTYWFWKKGRRTVAT